jgi:hypothetical protein
MRALMVVALLLSGCAQGEPLSCPEQGKVVKSKGDDGGLIETCTRWDGLKHGPLRQYHAKGWLKVEGSYREDRLEGVMTVYGPDGKVWERSLWKNDRVIRWLILNGEPVK